MNSELSVPCAGSGVSLWWVELDVTPAALDALASVLTAQERRHAGRLSRPVDRDRFVAARGWLRRLLSAQLSCAAGDVAIVTDAGGKPRVAHSDLRFSAARSAGIALYATSRTTELGVDIEWVDPEADLTGIARKFFSAGEQGALAAVPAVQRRLACYRCWTFKEALVKGLGTGLTTPVNSLDVWRGNTSSSLVPGWSVAPVDPLPDFVAAVAQATADRSTPRAPRQLTEDQVDPPPLPRRSSTHVKGLCRLVQ